MRDTTLFCESDATVVLASPPASAICDVNVVNATVSTTKPTWCALPVGVGLVRLRVVVS